MPFAIIRALAFAGMPAMLLAGCMAARTDADLSLAPAEETTFDIMLPDVVTALPEHLGRTEEAAPMVASLQPVAIEPAAFARFDEPVEPRSPELDRLIASYAAHYEVPEKLVRRVVKRESNFNPGARNGPYWGLMQIRHDTARGMGYRGPASGLLDAETNLTYAVRYLRGAYMVAGGDHDLAVRYYARGYYYDAKRQGLLEETGLGRDRLRHRRKI